MKKTGVQLISMKKEDIPIVASYFLKAFGPDGFGEPWSIKTSRKHLEEIFDPEYSFVAKLEEKVVGAVVGFPATYEHGTEIFIDTWVVMKDFRGKGIGTDLWERAIENAKEKDLVGVRLVGSARLRSFFWYKEKGLKESGWIELTRKL